MRNAHDLPAYLSARVHSSRRVASRRSASEIVAGQRELLPDRGSGGQRGGEPQLTDVGAGGRSDRRGSITANDRGVAIAIGEKKRRSPTERSLSLRSPPFSCPLSAPAILYRPLAARTGRGLMEIYDSHLIGFNVLRISSSRGSASSFFLRAPSCLLQGPNDLGD